MKFNLTNIAFYLSIGFFLSCNATQNNKQEEIQIPIVNHSFGNSHEVLPQSLHLDLNADFEKQIIQGFAEWDIKPNELAKQVIFDTKELKIEKVSVDGEEVEFKKGKELEIFGAPLLIPIDKNTKKVRIYYETSPHAEALQWLSKEQTGGKPLLFSQSQAILARTWVPCMDMPSLRFTYTAKISCPNDLLPLMSATNPKTKSLNSVYEFEMQQPIPSYLLALTIGDYEFKELGTNCGVYATPGKLQEAANEFVDLPKMIQAAEKLYGPYQWGRYDIVVMPAAFPFGGMENPRLTFATPTIVTGDKSLVSLIAHELAHSWSGNLVTNHTWSDFWLNEGFTVYFEDRIMEEIYGRDYADMMAKLSFGDLQNTVVKMMQTPKENDTKLFLNLENRNPDDGVSDIAYEKGRFFLLLIEKTVGRERFDAFLKSYFQKYAFKTITTEEFKSYLYDNLFQNPAEVVPLEINNWIYETGLPSNCPIILSVELLKLDSLITKIKEGYKITKEETKDWTTHHYLYFIRNINKQSTSIQEIDSVFGFSQWKNAEILCEWYKWCIEANYEKSKPYIKTYLANVGRRKFVLPLFEKMTENTNKNWKIFAKDIFKEIGKSYHSVTYQSVTKVLENGNS